MKKETEKNNITSQVKALGITLFATAILITLFGYMWKAAENISVAVGPRFDIETQKNMDMFAQCLADKNITMYGASWCTHCKKEKSAFGSSFVYVPYVECPKNAQLCLEKQIKGYPTWVTSDGMYYEGEQGLEKLAEITGCSLGGAVVEQVSTSTDTVQSVE